MTHDPDVAYKVGRVVMIRDGKLSTEIKRRVTFRPDEDADETEALDELTFVDPAGRVQLPREYLDRLKIKDRVKVLLEEDRLNIVPGDHEN